jgi:hypothetical protein
MTFPCLRSPLLHYLYIVQFMMCESKNAGSNMWLMQPLPDANRSPRKEIPTKADVPREKSSRLMAVVLSVHRRLPKRYEPLVFCVDSISPTIRMSESAKVYVRTSAIHSERTSHVGCREIQACHGIETKGQED